MEENSIQPEKFKDRIIFMSMYNGIDWGKVECKENLYFEFFRSCGVRKKDPLKDIGHSSDHELKKSGMERTPACQTVCGTLPRR